jgi:acyl-CoA dehydrogenase
MSWTPASLLRRSAAAPVSNRRSEDLQSWDLQSWKRALVALEPEGTFALAVSGGRRAATVGQAFCFGYQAALRAMLPGLGLGQGQVAALCATEVGGNHPRAIQTRLQDGLLTGHKAFVTLGPLAEQLVVVASTGQDAAGRNRLVGCVVDSGADGVTVTPMPPMPFVPDVPHGQLQLDGARPSLVLPGDGYTGLLKPFRTVEDIHVHAALAAWMLGVGVEAGWPDDVIEALLVAIAALAQAAAGAPSDPGTHRLLGGALAALADLVQRIEPLWADAPPGVAEMWARDRALMRIASGARGARLDRARAAHAARSRDGEG